MSDVSALFNEYDLATRIDAAKCGALRNNPKRLYLTALVKWLVRQKNGPVWATLDYNVQEALKAFVSSRLTMENFVSKGQGDSTWAYEVRNLCT